MNGGKEGDEFDDKERICELMEQKKKKKRVVLWQSSDCKVYIYLQHFPCFSLFIKDSLCDHI